MAEILAAMESGDEDLVLDLIEGGAQCDYVDQYGATPLIQACYFGMDIDVVKALLDAGCDVNYTNKSGGTALLLAVICRNDYDVIDLLLDSGADVNHRNKAGSTPLIYAVRNKNPIRVLQRLIQAGANVNDATNGTARYKGYTAMHFAAVEKGNDEMLTFLIKNGANIGALTANRKTCLDLASTEMRQVILKARDVTLKSQQAAATLVRFKSDRKTVAQAINMGKRKVKQEIRRQSLLETGLPDQEKLRKQLGMDNVDEMKELSISEE